MVLIKRKTKTKKNILYIKKGKHNTKYIRETSPSLHLKNVKTTSLHRIAQKKPPCTRNLHLLVYLYILYIYTFTALTHSIAPIYRSRVVVLPIFAHSTLYVLSKKKKRK